HAQFKGKHQKEYGWFAVSGTNPLLSVSVERAARQIVNTTRRNRSDLVIGWQARALMQVHANAPGLIAHGLGLVNRFLPGPEAEILEGVRPTEKKAGRESESAVTRSPLTALGRRAARRYNQTEVA